MLVRTDAGDGYLKAMGNPAGEHALACELVGTQLAAWFGLPVFDFAIIQVTAADELPFAKGGFACPDLHSSLGPKRANRGAAKSANSSD